MNNITIIGEPFRNRKVKDVVKQRQAYSRESQFQKDILDYLELIGALPIKVSKANVNGVSDILACYKGFFVAIEVKLPYNKPSDLQVLFLQKVEESGGVAMVLYPDTDWMAIINNRLGGLK